MSWARDNLSQAQREAECRELLAAAGRAISGAAAGEIQARCPLPGHDDKNPSWGYNPDKDVYNCSCMRHGDLVRLYAEVRGCSDTEALLALKAKYLGDGNRRTERPSAKPAEQPPSAPPPDLIIPEADWAQAKPLPPDWLDLLRAKRGWTPEAIQALDIRLFANVEDRRLPYVEPPGRVALPVRDAAGRLRNIRLYLPGAADYKIYNWFNGRKPHKINFGAPARPYPCPTAWDAHASLWLVEGEPDCVCAISQGLNAATKTGGGASRLREMLEHLRGREVIIAYDADLVGLKGALANAQELLLVGCRVRLLLWPPEMLAAPVPAPDGPEPDPQAEARLKKARQAAQKLALELGLPEAVRDYALAVPANHGLDLTDWIVKLGHDRASLEALAAAGPLLEPPAPHPAAESPASLGELAPEDETAFIRSCFGYSAVDDKTAYRSLLLVRALVRRRPLLTDRHSEVTYAYNGQVWRPLVRAELERLVIEALGVGAGRNRIAEAIGMLKAETVMPEGEEFDHRPELLCCANGMANLDTWEIIPHDPAHRCTYQFPWPFEPHNPPACNLWNASLPKALSSVEVRRELQQFFGYCLWRDYPWHKVLWLVGEGNNGKSVVLHVLQRLVGLERTANINIKELEKSFSRATLHKRSLNVFEEASADFFSTDYFKTLSAGERVQAEYKYGQPFEFKNMCKLAFSMNELPAVRDKSDGFYRRLLPIVFDHQFTAEDKDPFLKEKLEAELPGIFHWALVGLAELREQGDFQHCPATREALKRYMTENDPLKWFVDECCVVGADEQEQKDTLFEAYRKWARATELGRVMPKNKFFAALKRSLGDQINTEFRPSASEGPRPPRRVQGLGLFDAMMA